MPTGPNFIGIGMQKCGSTYLFQTLSKHPEIEFPACGDDFPGLNENVVNGKKINTLPKEVHFLKGRNETMGWQTYLSIFQNESKKTGEITPLYSDATRERIEELKKRCPDIRLFALLRHPVERDWSAIKMIAKRKNLLDNDNALLQIADYPQIVTMGNYVRLLENWLSVFPRNTFWFAKLEEIEPDPLSLMNTLARHIGASKFTPSLVQTERIHQGVQMPCPPVLREKLTKRHQHMYKSLFDMTGVKYA